MKSHRWYKNFTKAFIIISTILMCIYYYNIFLYKDIVLAYGDYILQYRTKAKTVGEFIKTAGINIGNNDKLNVDTTEVVKKDMQIYLERAFPVKLTYNNVERKLFATEIPVSQILKSNNIVLDEEDYINMKLDELVQPNVVIDIKDYTSQIIEKKVSIPFTEKVIMDNTIDSNKQEVVTKGANGEKIEKYKVFYMDGKECKRKKIGDNIIKQPVQKVIKKGTKKVAKIVDNNKATNVYKASNGKEYIYSKALTVTSTGYNCSELKGSTGYTATGMKAAQGIVAVDPKVIPLKSRLYIEGYGEAIAADTGGAIKGNKIDVYIENMNVLRSYGVKKNVKVYILK